MSDRRELLKGGAVVLATLKSPSVLANRACVMPSGFASMPTFQSHHPNHTPCAFYTVEHWQFEALSSRLELMDKTVADVLGGRSEYGPQTLRQVLTLPIARTGELAILQHTIAMVFNVRTTEVGMFLNTKLFREVWEAYQFDGTYVVRNTSVRWGEAEILTWLRVLMYH